MSVSLYMDHQVRAAVSEGLRRRGIGVLTAYEDGAAEFDDERILNRATELGRVVFTHDDDFLALAHQWQQTGRPFSGVIYTHQQHVTVGKAIEDLELIAQASEPFQMRNQIQYLPL